MKKLSFLVIAVLFLVVPAEASYLFRLTEGEIETVMSHYYPKGYDRDAVLRQMSAPFDCAHFGDVCREVGEDAAYRMLESAWTKARKQYPLELIDRAAQQDLEALSLRWFERLYPDGVPEKDESWGVFAGSGSCADTATATSGDFRIVHKSRRHNVGIVVWGRIRVEHFKKNFWGNFKRERAGKLEVEGIVYMEFPGFDPVVFQVYDFEEDAKQADASAQGGGLADMKVPYVEGCGGVPGSALWACTCSGFEPFAP